MKDHYTIKDVALMTGLTTRTIRSYMQAGFLTGEKIDGTWQFPSAEVNAFLEHPSVLPSIHTKNNGIVSDFLRDRHKTTNQMCAILDFPGEDGKALCQYFCRQYNTGGYGRDLHFCYADFDEYPRVILSGQAADVLKLLNQYYAALEAGGDCHEV